MADKSTGPKLSVRVRPDTDGFAAKLKASLAAIEKAQGPLKIKAELDVKNLQAFKPKIDFDASQLRKSIDKIVGEAATIRFKAEIDETSFRSIGADLKRQIDRVQAELKRLKEQAEQAAKASDGVSGKDASSTITVDADTAAAEAQIGAAARNRRSTIDVNANTSKATSEIKGMLAGLSGARTTTDLLKSMGDQLMNLDRAVPKMAGVGLGVTSIGGAALSSVGNVATLTASLSALAGAAGPLPAVAAALGAMGGTLATAFSGVGDALTASSEAASTKNAATAKSNAATIESAMDQVRQAQEAAVEGAARAAKTLRNARENLAGVQRSTAEATKAAAEGVTTASKDEAKAARNTAAAQKDLTQARRDAARQIKDLESQLKGAVLDGRELEQQLIDAKQAYAEALTDPTRGQGALDALKLQADRAAQAVADNKSKVGQLTADKAKADKAGVSGADGVLKAEQALADAREAQAKAVKATEAARANVTKTELANTRAIRDAREQLSEAEAAQAKNARDSSRATAAAAAALLAAQEAAAASATEANAAMENLTPNAREAVTALTQVKEQLGEVREVAQEAFFDGFAGPLKSMASTLIPQLKSGMGELAGVMGDGFETTMNAMSKSFGGGVLETMFSKTAEGAIAFNQALSPAVNALATLGTVGVDYLPRMGTAIADMTKDFDAFLTRAASDGSMTEWIENGITAMKDLGSVLGSTFSMLGSIGTAAGAAGGSTLSTLADGLEHVAELMKQEPFQSTMTTLFRGANDLMAGIGKGLGHVGDLMVSLAPTLETVMGLAGEAIAVIAEGVGGALSDPAFGAGLTDFFEGLLAGLNELLPVMPMVGELLGMVLSVAGSLAAALGPVLGAALSALIPPLNVVLEAVMPLIEVLGVLLVGAINLLKPGLEAVGAVTAGLAGALTTLGKSIMALFRGDFAEFFSGFGTFLLELVELPLKYLEGLFTGFGKMLDGWDLTGSGEAIIGGFVDGLRRGLDQAMGIVQGAMDWIRGFFPNSPAKHGPFSGSGWTKLQHSGTAISDQFAAGLSNTKSVDRAAEDLMRSATLGGTVTVKGQGSGSATAPAGGFGSTITVYEAVNARATATEIARLSGAGV